MCIIFPELSRVFGASPRPRILLENISENLKPEFDKQFQTVRAVDLREDVDQSEFDVLVTTISPEGAEQHLFVMCYGGPVGQFRVIDYVKSGQVSFPVSWLNSARGHEFHVPTDLDQSLQRFIHTRVIPVIDAQRENLVMGHLSGGPGVVTPFVTTARGEVLAGKFLRDSLSECWVLPPGAVKHAAECLAVAVDLWRLQDATRFPDSVKDWSKDPQWMTAPESKAVRDLGELRKRRDQWLADFVAKEAHIEAELADAHSRANADERQLLTAQGDSLVRAVERCLKEFGFEVKYMDDVWKPGDRLEDLRTSLRTDPSWSNLTEVRGYAKGAMLSDLLRIGRFKSRYMKAEGKVPSCSWYVANEFIASDPGSRPPILRSNDTEIETFGEDDGLAIGSVALFDMLMDLRQGLLPIGEAQRILREGRGRLRYDRRGVAR